MLRSIRDALKSHPTIYNRYKQSYQEQAAKVKADPEVIKLVGQYGLSEEDVTHQLANFREWLTERHNCEQCTGIATCHNMYKGHASTPIYVDGELRFEYAPCNLYRNQQRVERQKRLLKSHFIPKETLNVGFDDLVKDKGNIDAIKAASLFCLQFTEVQGKGLFFYGEFGVGKTYLMGAIANKLSEQGHSVYFVHVPTFCREIKASISDQSYIEKIAELENVDCLILDDIGAESFSPWIRDEVLGPIIQYRTQNERPILYTSNLDYDNLRTHLAESSHSQIDDLKAYRIAERIRSFTVPYKMYGENRRRN